MVDTVILYIFYGVRVWFWLRICEKEGFTILFTGGVFFYSKNGNRGETGKIMRDHVYMETIILLCDDE